MLNGKTISQELNTLKDDFTMVDYEPVKPQLTFELGV